MPDMHSTGDPPPVPSRAVFESAQAFNRRAGHENAGSLSAEHGFLPLEPPRQELPSLYQEWDLVAGDLPELFRSLRLRHVVDDLPERSFGPRDLPDSHVLRACSLVGILAHAYMRVEADPPPQLPPALEAAWDTLAKRLNRPCALLSYIDLILYNWKFETAPGRTGGDYRHRVVENMDLLFPTVGNEEERVFYLTQVETAAMSTPLLTAVIRAQEAAMRDDPSALTAELLDILGVLQHISATSVHKIDPNPLGVTHVDPVVWAKTVAPFAVPVQPGQPGPSGTAAPLFHLMDAFVSRPTYDAELGREAAKLEELSPRHWREFNAAVGQVSIRDYIERRGHEPLKDLFNLVLDAYAGDKGFLGVHRLKAYGFLEVAFKAGRSVTIGGFEGLFRDKTWNQIDGELGLTRDERYVGLSPRPYVVQPGSGGRSEGSVVLEGTGLVYQPGDRVGIWPENDPELVARTLRSLRATGNESIALGPRWQTAMRHRSADSLDGNTLPLGDLLRFARLRPLSRSALKTLHRLTGSLAVQRTLSQRLEDQSELWDVLDVLAESGFDPRRLWKAEPWEAHHISRLAPPVQPRLYSIASAPDESEALHIKVAALGYDSVETPLSPVRHRKGTASTYLHRVMQPTQDETRIPLKLVPAPRFHLPSDPTHPVVMFAAGSGVAPFLGFLQARAQMPESGPDWLFYGLRQPEDLEGGELLERLGSERRLELRVSCSRRDETVTATDDGLLRRPAPRGYLDAQIDAEATALWSLLRNRADGGQEGYFYICGRTNVASTVIAALQAVIRRNVPDPTEAQAMFFQLVADGRLLLDVFTTYTGTHEQAPRHFDASEIVQHNSADRGYWMVLDGRVLDLSEFVHMHAGGLRILANNAGIDATRAYESVQHHLNPEVDALLSMYEIGRVRRLDFGDRWGVAVGPEGLFFLTLEEAYTTWVRYLYLVTEMENAVTSDFSFMDRATTRGEAPAELSPLKVHLLAETHNRFVTTFLDGVLGEDLQLLWAITSGLCDPHAHVRELRDAVDVSRAGEAGALVRGPLLQSWLDRWRTEATLRVEASAHPQDTDRTVGPEDGLGAACALLRRADQALFVDLKQAVSLGVQAFERHERGVVQQAGAELLEAARRIPQAVEEYYTGLAAGLRSLGELHHLPLDVLPAPVAVPALLTGHGAQIAGRAGDLDA